MNHRFNVSAYVSVYICAQAFSANLKRSLNLSANKYYYYYYYYYYSPKGHKQTTADTATDTEAHIWHRV